MTKDVPVLSTGPNHLTKRLSPREAQVVELVIEGYGNDGVAAVLGLGVETVKVYMQKIFAKVGVNSRLLLAVTVLQKRHAEEIAAIHKQYQEKDQCRSPLRSSALPSANSPLAPRRF